MKKQERTREELIKELQELKQENQTLRTKYISEHYCPIKIQIGCLDFVKH